MPNTPHFEDKTQVEIWMSNWDTFRLLAYLKAYSPPTTTINWTSSWSVKACSLTNYPFASRRQAPWLSVVVRSEGALASSLAYAMTQDFLPMALFGGRLFHPLCRCGHRDMELRWLVCSHSTKETSGLNLKHSLYGAVSPELWLSRQARSMWRTKVYQLQKLTLCLGKCDTQVSEADLPKRGWLPAMGCRGKDHEAKSDHFMVKLPLSCFSWWIVTRFQPREKEHCSKLRSIRVSSQVPGCVPFISRFNHARSQYQKKEESKNWRPLLLVCLFVSISWFTKSAVSLL